MEYFLYFLGVAKDGNKKYNLAEQQLFCKFLPTVFFVPSKGVNYDFIFILGYRFTKKC